MRVRLIDMSDNPIEKIYKAYRICYSKDKWEDIKIPSEKEMVEFIGRYLKKGHTSPLEHVSFSFSVESLSRSALAQLTRHRTFKFNVQSQRYIDGNNFKMVLPSLSYMSKQKRDKYRGNLKLVSESLLNQYNFLIKEGVRKEDARTILPMNIDCSLIFTCDLHNFRNFLRQRMCSHAQEEIRNLAIECMTIVKPFIPFVNYDVMNCSRCGECSEK